MANPGPIVYFRNSFMDFNDASFRLASSPILYGLSTYTVFSVNKNPQTGQTYVFRLKDHYERLVSSAKIMDFHSFSAQFLYEKFKEIMLELIRRNEVDADSLVRVTVFIDEEMAGTKIHGLKNSLSAFVYPFSNLYPQAGINVCVSSWQRTADTAIPARAKVNGGYANVALMKNEALLNGYDDAIALDIHGHVAESTVANVFLVRGGVIITPDPSTDILEGITRDSVLKIAEALQMPTVERSIDRSELYLADEAFLCGSSAVITPILSIDKRLVGNGAPGVITQKLSQAYSGVQHGQNPQFAAWLQEV